MNKKNHKPLKDGQIIIFYDKENMKVYDFTNVSMSYTPICNQQMRDNDGNVVEPLLRMEGISFSGETDCVEVELDPTTMKRIAEYNKLVKVRKLDKQIATKSKELEDVQERLKNQNRKLENLLEFQKDFVNSAEIDIDNFIETQKDTYY